LSPELSQKKKQLSPERVTQQLVTRTLIVTFYVAHAPNWHRT